MQRDFNHPLPPAVQYLK